MPGKVNPTQCEAVSMVCAQVLETTQLLVLQEVRSLRAKCL